MECVINLCLTFDLSFDVSVAMVPVVDNYITVLLSI